MKYKIIILFFVHFIIAQKKYKTLFSFNLFIILLEFFHEINENVVYTDIKFEYKYLHH